MLGPKVQEQEEQQRNQQHDRGCVPEEGQLASWLQLARVGETARVGDYEYEVGAEVEAGVGVAVVEIVVGLVVVVVFEAEVEVDCVEL